MRGVLFGLLILLYAAASLGLAVWTALDRGEPAGSPSALPLPEGILWLGVAACLAIAVGAWLRLRAVRWLAILTHLLVVFGAITVFSLHLSGDRAMHGDHPLLETAAKVGVHALLLLYWLRSRAVAEHLGAPRRA